MYRLITTPNHTLNNGFGSKKKFDSGARHAMESAKKYGITRVVMYDDEKDKGNQMFDLNREILEKNELGPEKGKKSNQQSKIITLTSLDYKIKIEELIRNLKNSNKEMIQGDLFSTIND